MKQTLKHKKKRPISRKFWSYLKYLPGPIRAEIIRSRFEVEYNLPSEITLKQAETDSELRQALNLVHDSYVDLDYIDPNDAKMRFSKFHALPTTVILVAKWGDEVIGTLSIIPDSAMGLPVDTTWDIEKYRKNGNIIAEISSLAIKKDFRMRRGRLLMPLCKIMYEFCEKILQLDGIVIATTVEVEPFYTDILLFETVVEKTGQNHQMVKGNPSSCCFLPVGKTTHEMYKKVYSKRPLKKNLFKFFLQDSLPNIIFPDAKNCIQAYMVKKNAAQAKILREYTSLSSNFSSHDVMVLKNLDVADTLPLNLPRDFEEIKSNRKDSRLEIRFEGWTILTGHKEPVRCQILDISNDGFQLNLKRNQISFAKNTVLILVFEFEGHLIQCRAKVMWNKLDARIGCHVLETTGAWSRLVQQISLELNEIENDNVIPIRKKTAA